MSRVGPSTRQKAFLEEIELSQQAKATARQIKELKRNSQQIKRNIADLGLKRKCLLSGLAKWTRLSERAHKNVQGSEVLAQKYPASLCSEGVELKSFYSKVSARLVHEKADLEAQIVANDKHMLEEDSRRKLAAEEHRLKREKFNVLYNKIEGCQELQRHCLFASSLWQPTPA